MTKNENNPIPEAEPEAEEETELVEPGDLPDLVIGRPWAMANDCSLLPAAAGGPGSYLTIQCDQCGQYFRIDLLDGSYKLCPSCRTSYTHAVIVCRAEDDTIFDDAIRHVLIANEIKPPDTDDANPDQEPIPDANGADRE